MDKEIKKKQLIMTIINLEELSKLNVNIFEIENAVLNGESSFWTPDYEYLFMKSNRLKNYLPTDNEVVLETSESDFILVKKV